MASSKRSKSSKSRRTKNDSTSSSSLPVSNYSSFKCNSIGVSWDASMNSVKQPPTLSLPLPDQPTMSSFVIPKGKLNQGQKLTEIVGSVIREDFNASSYFFNGISLSNMTILAEFIRVYFHYVTPWGKSPNWLLSLVFHNRRVIFIDISHLIFSDFLSVLILRLYEGKPVPLIITIQNDMKISTHSQQNVIHIPKGDINAHAAKIAQTFRKHEFIPNNDLFSIHIAISKGSIFIKYYTNGPKGHYDILHQQYPKVQEKGSQSEQASETMISFEQHVGEMMRGFLKMDLPIKEFYQKTNDFLMINDNMKEKQDTSVGTIDHNLKQIARRPQEASLYWRSVTSKSFGTEFFHVATQTHEVAVEEDLLEILDEAELFVIDNTIEKIIMIATNNIISMQRKSNLCKQEIDQLHREKLQLRNEQQSYDKAITDMAKSLSRK